MSTLAADDPRRADLELIRRNAILLLSHVNTLLDAAKLDSGGFELFYSPVELDELTRLTASFFESRATDRAIEFTVVTPGEVRAQLDSHQLRRILINLLGNAFAVTPRGGSIRLQLGEEGEHVAFEVADSGPGVPLEERDLIFERFRQGADAMSGRSAGTGLGLSIVRDLVTLHGGSVKVGIAPEGGALFTVRLPAHAPAGTAVAAAAPLNWDADVMTSSGAPVHAEAALPPGADEGGVSADASGRALVLVVEDNADLHQVIRESLCDRYAVVSAFDGDSGVEAARQYRPSVIVTDLMMPRGGGDEIVAAVRSDPNLVTTGILVLSARADDAGRFALLEAGANDYLVKPFAIHELRVRVANLVALHRAEALQRALRLSDDRERIARDLHDLVIQRVFAAGMRLTALQSRTGSGDIHSRIGEVTADLDTVIATIRTTIFDLRHGGHSSGLRAESWHLPAMPRTGSVARHASASPVRSTHSSGATPLRTCLRWFTRRCRTSSGTLRPRASTSPSTQLVRRLT